MDFMVEKFFHVFLCNEGEKDREKGKIIVPGTIYDGSKSA
jgi:hypothetical protein